MSKSIGIIVDGHGDFASLRKRFKKEVHILKTDGPRGHTARPLEIARSSQKQLSILRALRCQKIIIVIDREERPQEYDNFVKELKDAFNSLKCDLPVHVIVPNRMIENWYLADIAFLSEKKAFIKNNITQKNYEGINGKMQIKRLMAKGHTYRETEHGPELFAILRFDTARKNSSSFNEFLTLL